MFLTHQTEIQNYAAQSPDNTFKVLRFVQMTIQQHFSGIPAMTEEINSTGACKRLSKRQTEAIDAYQTRKIEIHSVVFGHASVEEKLIFLASLPGFGLVKAGFCLQCLLGEAGCFDVHNCREYDIKPSDFTLRKNVKTNLDKAVKYLALCQNFGTAYLWDEWCKLIAEKYPKKFVDSDHVSRLHVDCIKAS